ncbi:MAG: biotin--[acetyl-CoA-carboxylase] ligase [Microbacterium sp.]|uniref:biotin--[acetyl-CoA-carboxylase] ligase n=1 Tax=Microbacterium sp. TaxID=51671 RepID=UPI0039E2E668
MSTPEHGYPLVAQISPRVQVVDTTGSTNADVVAAAAADPGGWPHLSLLLTTDQRHGRGRLDRTWTAPAGTALAVSVVARVPGLPVHARGWIPLIAGTAMARAVGAQLGPAALDVAVKWPNDVLVAGKKICGILAEAVPAHPDAVVVGAGVNTRMRPEDLPVTTATSFAALGHEADEDRLLADYLTQLRDLLAALTDAGGDAEAAGIRDAVSAACATLGAEVTVSLPDGSQLTGTAARLDAEGRLVVAREGVEAVVAAGDVTHVR